MEILAILFFFIFIMFFTVLALTFRSETLFIICGFSLIVFAYMLLTYGITGNNVSGKSENQTMSYIFNDTTNTTQLSSTSIATGYVYDTVKNDYTNGFGTISLGLSIAFLLTPIVSRWTKGKVKIL